jgi:hypothetical protein
MTFVFGFRVSSLEFRVWGSGPIGSMDFCFQIQGLGIREWGLGNRD